MASLAEFAVQTVVTVSGGGAFVAALNALLQPPDDAREHRGGAGRHRQDQRRDHQRRRRHRRTSRSGPASASSGRCGSTWSGSARRRRQAREEAAAARAEIEKLRDWRIRQELLNAAHGAWDALVSDAARRRWHRRYRPAAANTFALGRTSTAAPSATYVRRRDHTSAAQLSRTASAPVTAVRGPQHGTRIRVVQAPAPLHGVTAVQPTEARRRGDASPRGRQLVRLRGVDGSRLRRTRRRRGARVRWGSCLAGEDGLDVRTAPAAPAYVLHPDRPAFSRQATTLTSRLIGPGSTLPHRDWRATSIGTGAEPAPYQHAPTRRPSRRAGHSS
jgi:hypothetical protein